MSIKYIVFLLVNLVLYFSGNSQKIKYLDKNYPGLKPQIYAPGVISLPNRCEHGLTLIENEHIIGVDGHKSWTYNALISLKKISDGSLVQDTLEFTSYITRKNNAIIAGEPSYTSAHHVMYFVADYPTEIWKVTIRKRKWGIPVKLDTAVNSKDSEWYPVIASDNCLYFSRNGIIHKATLIYGEYKKVSKLEATFNYDCGDQVFSENMDYIIFSSSRPGGFGNNDLYIAFKKENGEWTDGINLGSDINSEGFELAPYISPDHKYLFFTRRDKYNNAFSSDIYWVSLDIINNLRIPDRRLTSLQSSHLN